MFAPFVLAPFTPVESEERSARRDIQMQTRGDGARWRRRTAKRVAKASVDADARLRPNSTRKFNGTNLACVKCKISIIRSETSESPE